MGRTRSTVSCSSEFCPTSRKNCFGKCVRDNGHKRVPEPPQRSTGNISPCLIKSTNSPRLRAGFRGCLQRRSPSPHTKLRVSPFYANPGHDGQAYRHSIDFVSQELPSISDENESPHNSINNACLDYRGKLELKFETYQSMASSNPSLIRWLGSYPRRVRALPMSAREWRTSPARKSR